MTDEELQKLLIEWKERLGLQSWRIKLLTNCRPENMADPEADGCVDYQESSKTARIELIDPIFYGERVIPYDAEKTLVHELMHLKMSLYFEGDAMLERVSHMILDDLARALVEAKRA
jgi:hypothetical protein